MPSLKRAKVFGVFMCVRRIKEREKPAYKNLFPTSTILKSILISFTRRKLLTHILFPPWRFRSQGFRGLGVRASALEFRGLGLKFRE